MKFMIHLPDIASVMARDWPSSFWITIVIHKE